MDKLLTVIASGLDIRSAVNINFEKVLQDNSNVIASESDYQEVINKARRRFKKEFKNHLFNKLKKIEVGEYVDYYFDYGNIRPLGIIMERANDNMAEVLIKLPTLKDGECYVFPHGTYISFELIERYQKGGTVKLNSICSWIKEAYTKK